MGFAPGWDRRSRLTLRFRDPALESAYQADTIDAARRRHLVVVGSSIPLWLLGALIAPAVFPGIDSRPLYLVCGVVIALLVATGILTLRAPTRRRIDGYGLAVNVTVGVVQIWLITLVGMLDTFGSVVVVFTAIVGLSVQRLPFTYALTSVVVNAAAFSVAALAAATGAPLQIFVVVTALAVTSSGTYLSEDGERELFAQRRLIVHLHERLDGLLRTYLSPDVARTLIEDPGRAALGGEIAEVTVLFADLAGFTQYSELVSPGEAVSLLNSSFAATVPMFLDSGGTIIQFAGDSLMAIWNAPVTQPDHAVRAARAALAMQVAASPTSVDPRRPQFRVGLNTGRALVGNIGSPELRNFTAIGDTTNLAARIQTFAEPGTVVVSESTMDQIRDKAELRALGSPELKGKSMPVALFQLLAMRDGGRYTPDAASQ